ncbi:MAG: rane protein [Segetibacter sp.]|jgi:uncharacterized membrane-anchored protein YitT (DUF2179 family)|nr:rane protein [Segetibacter sp.]
MIPIWTSIAAGNSRSKQEKENNSYSFKPNSKREKIGRTTINRHIKDFVLITLGIFSAAFGFKGFLLTNHFIDGGATGISLLISALTSIPLSILLIGVNIPFIILAYNIIGKAFAVKTILAISGLALVVATVTFPNVTNDNLLVAVFGGFFLGAGIGLSVRGGAVIDGTEVLAIFLSRKFGTTIGDIIIIINVVIFSVAAYFLSIEVALYSMITYLAASKTLDFIIDGIEEYTGVTIISKRSDEVKTMITEKLGHGVTLYRGESGVGTHGEATDIKIVYTVLTRLELNKLKSELEKIDENAFVIMSSIRDTKGGMVKKRGLKH